MIGNALKSLIPSRSRLWLRVQLIKIRDLRSGDLRRMAKNSPQKIAAGRDYPERLTIIQRINVSKWADNKKHNLRLAIAKFQNLPILPNEIFSFWNLVGEPNRKEGYKVGINIIKSRLDFDYGGGLCQLSGLLYHLALTAGLNIVERYPHSVDLYTDETRYTPLGADATTAYGYKDLRLGNNLGVPFAFRIHIKDNSLIGSLCAPEPLKAYELKFEKTMVGEEEKVTTMRRRDDGEFEEVCRQRYAVSNHSETI